MHILIGIVILVLDIVTAVHAVRTGRTTPWVTVILFVPVIGALIYVIAIMMPELKARQRAGPIETEAPDLATLETNLRRTDSLLNRERLARAYLESGKYDDAVETARTGIGSKRVDGALRLVLARALYERGDRADARRALEELEERNPDFAPRKRDLLLGRIAEDEGDLETAAVLFASAARRARGEEARFRHGSVLERPGRDEEAMKVFERIVRNAEDADRTYVDREGEWIRRAQRAVRS